MSSKIHYKSVPENRDYLLVDVKCDIARLTMREDIEQDVYSELQSIYFKLFTYEHDSVGYIKEPIAIKKDSIVGKYILSHPEVCLDDDLEVTYDKVVNSYLVATFSNDFKKANKIEPLFIKKVSGTKDELVDKYDSKILDYILEHDNFYEYLDRLDEKDNNKGREYIVYENGQYSKKTLFIDSKDKLDENQEEIVEPFSEIDGEKKVEKGGYQRVKSSANS